MKNKLLDLFFPKTCPACGEVIAFGKKYCGCCGNYIKRTSENFCEHCASSVENCCCNEKSTMKLEHITAAFVYTGVIKERLLLLKFRNEKSEADYFGTEMALHFAAAFPNVKADVVTFVPMTENEKRERGYNQSELLAKRVAKAYFTNCKSLLIKTEETQRQHTLSSENRIKNLKNSFAAINISEIEGKTVLLCDDIKTTGTTLKRCSDILLQNGAKDVYCLAAAISDYVSTGAKIF